MQKTILIVDDNAINRQMLKYTLSNEYTVLEASNGMEAIDAMRGNAKNLSAVLLDVVMPKMDGYQVLEAVKSDSTISHIPIIIVTGSEEENSRIKALSLGASDFIVKPFNPDIIKHCLKNNIALTETSRLLNAIQRDKLTGLYKRETFFEKAQEMIQSKKEGYYIFSSFDIDHFKLINDQYGTQVGDNILIQLGQIIKAHMQQINGIAGRIAGDNFAVLFPMSQRDNDTLQEFQEHNLPTFFKQPFVFSVGRYIVSDTSLPASTIYDRAFIAKQSVKGRYDKHVAYFDNSMLENLLKEQTIVSEMETALVQKQFELWFQPQFNHATGAAIGAEALVRWRHPKQGIVPPNDFIPLFEKNGFIYELDKYVWEESCACLKKWIEKGIYNLPISVNISRYDILRQDMADTIIGLVKQYNIPPHLLHLEITESAFAHSQKQIVSVIKELVDFGFTVEIDDFGSDYSSLNILKNIPAQVLKLDMKFLFNIDDNGTNRGGNILESVVRMTKWLDMAVIAEGVETQVQADFLKSIGCNHIQGYLYAKPMPQEQFEKFCKTIKKEPYSFKLKTVKHLNNNLFWSPESLDSLIFNTYVGAACIFEYFNGNAELLRVNDNYLGMLGAKNISVDAILSLDLNKHLGKEGTKHLKAFITNVLIPMGEGIDEFVFHDIPNLPPEIYLRSTMRIVATAEERYLIYCLSENITEQRLAERTQRRISQQLQTVLSNINCGITAFSFSDNIAKCLMANDMYYSILGYTKEQYEQEIGKKVFTPLYPQDKKMVVDATNKILVTKKPRSIEYRAIRRDGKVIWIRSLLSMTSFEDIEGDVQICTYVDITEERKTTQDLIDNLPCGAGICTTDGKTTNMVYLNKRYFSYFKHRNTWDQFSSVYDVIHPDDRETLRYAMHPALKEGGEGSCVVRILDGENDYIAFKITGIALEENKNQKSIYVTFLPVSQEGLSYKEMLSVVLEAMMANSANLAFVKDKNLKYICCTKRFAQMVGLENEKQIVGKTDFDIFNKEFAQKYIADDKKLMQDRQSIVNTLEEIPSDDGTIHFSRTSKHLLYDAGKNIIGIYGSGSDVTETLKKEARLNFLLNNIPGGIAVYEGKWNNLLDFKLTYFSDGFCNLFGFSREEYTALGDKNPTGLIRPDFLEGLKSEIESLVTHNTPIDYIYKATIKDGSTRWIHVQASISERHGDLLTVTAAFSDVTDRQNATENLRISEEENRLAIRHGGNVVCRLNVEAKTLTVSPGANPIFEMDTVLQNVPYSSIEKGDISSETADIYVDFYQKIFNGEKSGMAVFQRKSTSGWRWIDAHFSTIFSSDNKPVSAIISFLDVTETFEKDAVYKKWRQTFFNRDKEAYSLFRCNLSKKRISTQEGNLVDVDYKNLALTFDACTADYADKHVFFEDKKLFFDFLKSSHLLKKYNEGQHVFSLDYRENIPSGGYRWLKLSVDLVETTHSSDIEAYMLFENIDTEKREELNTKRLAETDTLTGLLNRTTFEKKVNEIIAACGDQEHALLMLDIDGFKYVNDVFGHDAGDNALKEISNLLQTTLRKDDLVGRLGGDEFVVFLRDLPSSKIAGTKAKKICQLTQKSYSAEVRISSSIGISLFPLDGKDFATLYKKADQALYFVKGSSRNNYAFYHDNMKDEHLTPEPDQTTPSTTKPQKKRRMLIIDDNRIDYEMLANIFHDEFIIEKATDGNMALIRLRHYGKAISVVLLDLMMPGLDGFGVLERMQQSPDLRDIPVIVVSADDNRETGLKAIRCGANDFVTKPIDSELLTIRVKSAISKAENEQLKIKNAFLELKNSEKSYYKILLERSTLVIIETDTEGDNFTYYPNVQKQLWGIYDTRSLWHILIADGVTDSDTVVKIQKLFAEIAGDKNQMDGKLDVQLKTALGQQQMFSITIYKVTDNEIGTEKIFIVFSSHSNCN